MDLTRHGIVTPALPSSPYYEVRIKEVRPGYHQADWGLFCTNNTILLVSRADIRLDVPEDFVPRVGDVVRLFGERLSPGLLGEPGGTYHGIAVSGVLLWYAEFPPDPRHSHRFPGDYRVELQDRLERDRGRLDGIYAGLSEPLRRHVDLLRAEDTEFRWSEEARVLVRCVDADLLLAFIRRELGWQDTHVVDALEAHWAFEAFLALGIDVLRAEIPGLFDAQEDVGATRRLVIGMLTGR
jgi:hypothetical protein